MEVWQQIWTSAFLVGILGNLVASALWAIPALRHLHKKIDRNHREHLDLLRAHGIIKETKGGETDALFSS